MIVIIGFVILIGAVIIGVAAVVGNIGEAQQLSSNFTVFDYHFHGSTGALFAYGVALGAIGMFGLAIAVTGAWRVARRGAATRRELRQSRREMAAVQRDLAASEPDRRKPNVTGKPAWIRGFRKSATAPAGDAPHAGGTRNAQASTSK